MSSGQLKSFSASYEKIRTVGKGAFGTAVLHKRLSDSRLVVLKEINMTELSASERQMALNEVQVLSVLHHPNIISYLGSFEMDGMLIIEMEYADGGTLSQLIDNSKDPIKELEILVLFKQVVSAIQYMHEHNILHRDLKTANIFLTKTNIIKVGDFGISKLMNTKSQAHTVLGTPYYLSPEMCEGKEYDQKSDMWALGCILYEIACREKTFQGTNLPALVNKIMKGTYEPLPRTYTSSLKVLVSDLLQKNPVMRPPASVVMSRIRLLEGKLKVREIDSAQNSDFEPKLNQRSVLYNLSGYGSSFSLIPIKLPVKCKIIHTAVSASHYAVLTSDSVVYTWGEGKKGQLGHGGCLNWLNEPTIVETLVNRSIAKISVGNGFSVFVSEAGMVFTCGDGSSGCLGHGDTSSLEYPKTVESLLNFDVIDVSCGDTHVLVLTRDNRALLWGTLNGKFRSRPAELDLPAKLICESVKSGPDASVIVTLCGQVLVIGNNKDNRLGLNQFICGYQSSSTESVDRLILLPKIQYKVQSVSIGRSHTALLTECGRVITMGSNSDSQLGHSYKYPSEVESVSDRVATTVACGPTYTVIGTKENALYFWGTRFTQGCELSDLDAKVSMTTLETHVVPRPQEILVLYSSEYHVLEGRIVTLNSVYPLWHCIYVLVDTTAPLRAIEPMAPSLENEKSNESLEIPDWIREELEQATDEWPGLSVD